MMELSSLKLRVRGTEVLNDGTQSRGTPKSADVVDSC